MHPPFKDQPSTNYVSTGDLPPDDRTQILINQAYRLFQHVNEGNNADYYPALAQVSPDLFAICITSVSGKVFTVGDVDHEFTIMSVAKPFTFSLVAQELGFENVRDKLGFNATGMPFNSIMAVELQPDHVNNPMVNTGAIAAVSLIPGKTADEKWHYLLEKLSQFAGRTLSMNREVYESASASNFRNRALTHLVNTYGNLFFDPMETLDVYTRQSCLNVTTKDLATMAATLADGGVNPVTLKRIIDEKSCRYTLAVMATAGMYENSGQWLAETGLPAKSGVGGGIITAASGKGGLATFSPPLDKAGNSVRGQLVTRYLSDHLGLNLFAAKAVQEI